MMNTIINAMINGFVESYDLSRHTARQILKRLLTVCQNLVSTPD